MQFQSCLYCNRAMTVTNNETICSSCRILVNRSVGLVRSEFFLEPRHDLERQDNEAIVSFEADGIGTSRSIRERARERPQFRARNPEAFAYEYYNLTGEIPDSTYAGEHLPPLTLASDAFQLDDDDPATTRLGYQENGLTRDRRAVESVLQELKKRTLTKSNLAECNKECAICTEKFENLELTMLPCNHEYHSGCIDHWLSLNASCPICRYSLLPTRETQGRVPESPPSTTAHNLFVMYQDYLPLDFMDDVD